MELFSVEKLWKTIKHIQLEQTSTAIDTQKVIKIIIKSVLCVYRGEKSIFQIDFIQCKENNSFFPPFLAWSAVKNVEENQYRTLKMDFCSLASTTHFFTWYPRSIRLGDGWRKPETNIFIPLEQHGIK